jgi:exodeoxyribonuclease V alpha subunit
MLHELHYPGVDGFAIGEPVIITKNLYDLGVLNGDEGTVAGVNPLTVRIGENLVEFPEDLECFVELAYAVTVHKAQGSSCKMAIVLLPDQPTCMISRRLLYVALTRAEKRCVVLHQCESLTQAVYSVYEHDRKTLLGERLCGKKR